MKRVLCALLALIVIYACGAGAEDAPNWYEVFVRSYRDANGDGLGDLRGLTEKLDYIEDMGWRGLWLMPVMPSLSYHKYDVTDYKAIDPEYGTLEDMRALVAACHARDIKIIIDLPINHTSTQHPWFIAACDALRSGNVDDTYVGYYNFSRDGNGVPVPGTDWRYEEQFAGGNMPDLNLDNPAVLDEIRDIFEFWLGDVGVDGFRLDAVTSFFTGDQAANIALLARLKAMAEEIAPGSYLVGECWAGLGTIADYYASGVDSFFLFPASQAEGFVCAAMRARSNPAAKFASAWQGVLDAIPEGTLAPFLSNHDTGRTVGLVQGRGNPGAVKFAHGLMGMLGGRVFTYYGEEIGMVGSGDDPNKRLAMDWSDGDMTLQPPGVTSLEYAYPGVGEQINDPDSILNYVRAVNTLRLAHPAISAGDNEFLLADGDVCVMRRTCEAETCLIAINFSSKQTRVAAVPACDLAAELETGDGQVRLRHAGPNTLVSLPPCAIAVLTPKP